MPKYFAQIISLASQPELLLIILSAVLVYGKDFSELFAAIIFLILGGVPFVVSVLWEYWKSADELEPDRRERNIVFLVSLFSFSACTIVFGSQIYPNEVWFNLSMAIALLFAALFIINRYFDKASVHVAVFSLVTMYLVDKFDTVYALLFALLPLVIWARIELKKHSWLQVLWGLALGLFVGLLTWTF